MVISARNGALVSNFETQVEQFLEKSNKTLPPHVYVFFSGNDLCRKEDNAQASTPTPEFEKGLREGLKKLNEVTQKGDSLPVIHLVSYLDITQLLNILGKTIEVKDMQGKRKLSCDSFINEYYQKKSNKNEELVNQVIRANSYHPMNMCFNVLSNAKSTPATDKSAHIQILKNQIQSYREALKKVATTSQDLTNLKLQVETGTEKLVVEEKDMANDCFHLSFDGQKKLAQAIARSN